MIKMKRKLSDFILSLLVLLAGIIVFIPFMYMFSSSMRTPAEAFKLPPAILPERFMIENYIQLFKSDLPFAKMFLNSTIVTGITIVIQMLSVPWHLMPLQKSDSLAGISGLWLS